jgi:hypothetical protein
MESMILGGVLKTLLDRADRTAVQVCTNAHGSPWGSESSFRSAFFKVVRDLQERGLLGVGTTFHGLRHTVGANARDTGESDFRVAAAIGDRTTAMAAVYGRDAQRLSAQASVLEAVQARFQDAPLSGPAVSEEELSP